MVRTGTWNRKLKIAQPKAKRSTEETTKRIPTKPKKRYRTQKQQASHSEDFINGKALLKK